MRRGFNGQILFGNTDGDTKGRVIGMFFGSDFCAEHEWGIEDLLEAVEIHKGLSKPRRGDDPVYKVFEDVVGKNGVHYNAIFLGDGRYVLKYIKEEYAVSYVCEYLFPGDNGNKPDGTFTAWDGKSFGILFPMDKVEEFQAVKAIIDSRKFNLGFIQRTPKDKNPFGRTWGLCLLAEGCENELDGFEIIK